MRLERLSLVQVPDTDDIEHLLSSIYDQMDDNVSSAGLIIWFALAQALTAWGGPILALQPRAGVVATDRLVQKS